MQCELFNWSWKLYANHPETVCTNSNNEFVQLESFRRVDIISQMKEILVKFCCKL